jgi:hypothetical protein
MFAPSGADVRKRAEEALAEAFERAAEDEKLAAIFADNGAAALRGERPIHQGVVGQILAAKAGFKPPPPDGTPCVMANGEAGVVRNPKRPGRKDFSVVDLQSSFDQRSVFWDATSQALRNFTTSQQNHRSRSNIASSAACNKVRDERLRIPTLTTMRASCRLPMRDMSRVDPVSSSEAPDRPACAWPVIA